MFHTVRFTFQDPVTPIMYGISLLHDHILFFLVLILGVVAVCFRTIFIYFFYEDYYGRYFTETTTGHKVYWDSHVIIKHRNVEDKEKDYLPYNKGQGTRWSKLNHGVLIEIIWTVIPILILFLIALPSFALLYAIDEVKESKVIVKVIGHQWYWSYEVTGLARVAFRSAIFDSYMLPDSELVKGELRLLKTNNALILPKNTPILLLITSDDVLHSWAVPAFGVKLDAVPGRLSQTSLFIKNSGVFMGQCSELCGVNHGFMPIEVWAVDIYTYARLEMLTKEWIHLPRKDV